MADADFAPKERLPAFKTMEECLAYCEAKSDGFYLAAFMLEAWLGTVVSETVVQYAENKAGKRRLQIGRAWQAWQEMFGHAKAEELSHIVDSLARFSRCDTGEAENVAKMLALATTEDRFGEAFMVSSLLGREGKKFTLPEIIAQMHYVFRRMAEWLESIIHWEIHWMAATASIAFGATEEHRELANIGISQANYANLSEHSKDWWHFRHEQLSKQFRGNRDWRIVGKAQSFEKWGELRHAAVDELTIYWWPLLTRYNWTDRDMRGLLRQVVPHPDAYPLREDKEFADYRQKALGLVKGKADRDRSSKDGKPKGWQVALEMVGKLSE